MTNPANMEPGSTLLIDFKLCSIGKCDQARRKNALRNTVIFNRIDLGGEVSRAKLETLGNLLLSHVLFNSVPVCGGSVHRDGCRMRVSYLIVLAKETLQGQRASVLHHLPNCPLLYSPISLIFLSCSLVPFKSSPAFCSFGLFLIFHTLCLSVSGSLLRPPSCQSNAPSPPSLLSGLRRERRAAVAAAASQDVFFLSGARHIHNHTYN